MSGEWWEDGLRAQVEGRGEDVGGPGEDVGCVVKEKEVDSGEADEWVDVQEE